MRKGIATSLCAVIFLTLGLAPAHARTNNGSGEGERPFRLYATAYPGPIGQIADGIHEAGSVTINGRRACAGQFIWSGDLLQCGASRVSVSVESIGQITLSRETAVRVATARVAREDGLGGPALVASLTDGELSVRLEPRASAYLRVAGTDYSSSEGADFVASAKGGHAVMNVKHGTVLKERQASQHDYSIRPVGHGNNIRVQAGELRKLQVQVIEDDKPVPGVAVSFALDTSGAVIGLLGMGTLSGTTASVVTGDDGIAAVQFIARTTTGSGPISATIEGTRVSWTGQITVTSKGVSRGTGWTIAALVGAGAAAGIAYALTREKDKLQAQPPVVKNP